MRVIQIKAQSRTFHGNFGIVIYFHVPKNSELLCFSNIIGVRNEKMVYGIDCGIININVAW